MIWDENMTDKVFLETDPNAPVPAFLRSSTIVL